MPVPTMSTALNCYAVGCGNGGYRFNRWLDTECQVHKCKNGTESCTCPQPFKLFSFPTEKQDAAKRLRWLQQFRRGDVKDSIKYKEPSKGNRVCSDHFVDGAPTDANPDPTLKLGHKQGPKRVMSDSTPRSQRNHKRRRIEIREEPDPMDDSTDAVSQDQNSHTVPAVLFNAVCLIVRILLALWRKVSTKLGVVQTENQKLKDNIGQLKAEIAKLKADARHRMSVKLLKTSLDVRFYTGLDSLETFHQVHNMVSGFVGRRWTGVRNSVLKGRQFHNTPKKFGPKTKLSSQDELLLTLMKLRLGLLNYDLAKRFKVSSTLASQIFNAWLTAMSMTLGERLVFNYSREHVNDTLPARFRDIPRLRSIIDCSEIFIETPKDMTLQHMTYSNYKHHNTVKFLIGVAPNSMITFISKGYGGRNSDKRIVNRTGYLDLLDPYDTLMADKGFNIGEECLARHIHLYVPPGKRGAAQMSSAACHKTKRIANRRILVEQVIRRLKTFTILKTQMPITLVSSVHKILRVCAALTNLSQPIYKN